MEDSALPIDDWDDEDETTKPDTPALIRKKSGTYKVGTVEEFEALESARSQTILHDKRQR